MYVRIILTSYKEFLYLHLHLSKLSKLFHIWKKKNPLYYLKYVNLKENVNKLEFFILLRNTNKFPIIILGLRRVEYIF